MVPAWSALSSGVHAREEFASGARYGGALSVPLAHRLRAAAGEWSSRPCHRGTERARRWAGRRWTSAMTHGHAQGHHDSERHRGLSPVNGRDEVILKMMTA
ncbi:hypothetical protein EYF80_047140 [Liparis tanakae]|uniref:Uncharacterized protein n=1 Tax=Liparis tanakae TaxID=230148 RepID=A0A4Z2FN56_9TELE|nr:hypothetical protein EYF80_047140 [Liparis tanakae]